MKSGISLEARIENAEREIRKLAQMHCAKAGTFHFGAVEIDPKHLAIWITTPTDTERNKLRTLPGLEDQFRQALADAGYPPLAVPLVGFAYESQETVDRHYGGNWWHAVK